MDVPNIFVQGCICHSMALCANHAAKLLPSRLEGVLRDIGAYFSCSAKRQCEFGLIQDAVGEGAKHKILKLCDTRWLSRGAVVGRILEQWTCLKLFFQTEMRDVNDRTEKDKAGHTYQIMNSSGTEHMLLFLHYILPKIDRLNAQFQSTSLNIHRVSDAIRDGYRGLLSLFVVETKIKSTDFHPQAAHGCNSGRQMHRQTP